LSYVMLCQFPLLVNVDKNMPCSIFNIN